MGTYCALHVQTTAKESVVESLEQYLASAHPGESVSKGTAETFGHLYGDEFICSESQASTKFAVISEQAGWFTAFYNSFSPLHKLAFDLSRRLHTVVIVTFAQTTSSCYHLSIFRSGQHLWTLEFADGEWVRQEGALLDFESEPLGKNIAREGETPWYLFEAESVSEYCEHYGLKFWSNANVDLEHPEFTILSERNCRATRRQ